MRGKHGDGVFNSVDFAAVPHHAGRDGKAARAGTGIVIAAVDTQHQPFAVCRDILFAGEGAKPALARVAEEGVSERMRGHHAAQPAPGEHKGIHAPVCKRFILRITFGREIPRA